MSSRLFHVLLAITLVFVLLAAATGLMSQEEAQAQPTSDRWVTMLSSSQRITSTVSSDQQNVDENLNVRGAYFTLDVTGVLTTPVVTLTVQAKDPASSAYEAIFTAASGVSATGTHSYLIYPGAGSANEDVVETLSYPLPPQWRVSVEHADTDPITYTVGVLLLP